VKKLIIITALIICIPVILLSEMYPKVGTAGVQFLKLGIDARAIGMGEAYTAISDDISSVYWNPAGLALKTESQALFSHTQYVAEIMHDFFAFSMYTDYGAIGFSGSLLHMPALKETTEEKFGFTGKEFYVYDLAAGLTYSNEFTDKFSFGFTGKYIRESLDEYAVNGFSFDLGTLYNTGWKNITIGMALRNYGPNLKYEVDSDDDGKIDEDPFDLLDNDNDGLIDEDREEIDFKIPMNFSFGISADLYRVDNDYLIGSFQIDNCVDREEVFQVGLEYKVSTFFIRAGSKINTTTSESKLLPSFGLGHSLFLMRIIHIQLWDIYKKVFLQLPIEYP